MFISVLLFKVDVYWKKYLITLNKQIKVEFLVRSHVLRRHRDVYISSSLVLLGIYIIVFLIQSLTHCRPVSVDLSLVPGPVAAASLKIK